MDVNIAVILLCWLFRRTPALSDSSAEEGRGARRAGGFDSDFDKFMSKMFSVMPQGSSTVVQEKAGPNAGYMPYWQGYNFQKGDLKQQYPQYVHGHSATTQDWDYGLSGAKGKNIWAPNDMVIHIGGIDGMLGAGAHVNDDVVEATEPPRPRPPEAPLNWGPTGKLGVPATAYDKATLKRMKDMTKKCLDVCTQEDKNAGIVCALDPTNTFYEIDRCVLKKNNCFQGVAYIEGWWWDEDYKDLIAVQDGFVRVSIRGQKESKIWMREAFYAEDTEPAGFKINVNSDNGGWHSWITLGQRIMAWYWPFSGSKYFYAIYWDSWTEYTMIWNSSSNWFLMSQSRVEDYMTEMHLPYEHYRPLDLRYIAVSGRLGNHLEYILHDLPTDLEEMNTGTCDSGNFKEEVPEDTDEIIKKTDEIEKAYKQRMRNVDWYGTLQKGPKWHVEGGSDGEY